MNYLVLVVRDHTLPDFSCEVCIYSDNWVEYFDTNGPRVCVECFRLEE